MENKTLILQPQEVCCLADLSLMLDVIPEHLFGLPINDPTFLYSKEYLVDYAGRSFFALHSFYTWLVIYFGIVGVAFIVWIFWKLIYALREKRERAFPLLAVVMFSGATGSGYTSIVILPLAIALSYIRYNPPLQSKPS